MTLIVDINHWLDENGELPSDGDPRLRRNALRIIRLIEYGGPLEPLHGRETLIDCKRKPNRRPCPGFMWVVKRNDDRIEAWCAICHEVEAIISGWQGTLWAEGVMPPVPMTDD